SGPAGMPLRSYHPHRARGHDQVVDRRAARRQGALVEDDDFGTGDPGQPPPEPDLAAGGSIGGAPVTALGPARGFAEDVVGVDGGALETLDLPVDDGCHLCLVPHAASAVAAFEPRPCAVRSCWRPAREAPHLTAGRQIVRSPSGGHPAPAGRARAVPAEPDHPRFGLHPLALRASGTLSNIGATDGTREGFDRWRADGPHRPPRASVENLVFLSGL